MCRIVDIGIKIIHFLRLMLHHMQLTKKSVISFAISVKELSLSNNALYVSFEVSNLFISILLNELSIIVKNNKSSPLIQRTQKSELLNIVEICKDQKFISYLIMYFTNKMIGYQWMPFLSNFNRILLVTF